MHASVRHLRKDERFAPLVKKYGAPVLSRYHGKLSVFEALLRSIIYQQLSGKAAAAIHGRVLSLFPAGKPAPKALLKLNARTLRAAGLSLQKVGYVRDLARKCLDGTIDERKFPTMTSEEIIEHLVQVKGIGVWTAHMLLIFSLERPDVLPTGDLAIRKGFQKLYRMRSLPTHKQMERLAKPWRAHATAASWYLWRIIDEDK